MNLMHAPTDQTTWINPLGGLGDALMLSGVLKLSLDYFPSRRYHLVRRTKYHAILEGHPAIDRVGFPPDGATIIDSGYWSRPEYGKLRAFQVLAGIFGLPLPVEETLYLPGIPERVPLFDRLPFERRTVLIAQASDSPRKEMAIGYWEELTGLLTAAGCFVIQAGRHKDRHIRGAYSLLGLTTPRELAALVGRCQAVVTSDSFIMHAARLMSVPAVVLWGPTTHEVYGYAGHLHLSAAEACPQRQECIGTSENRYQSLCHLGPAVHCLNRIGVQRIYESVLSIT